MEVERAARPVTVHRFDVAAGPDPGVFSVEVECSAGTYVRVLAADLGAALGGGAHLRNLRRTAIGPFTVAEARRLDALAEAGPAALLAPAVALRHLDARSRWTPRSPSWWPGACPSTGSRWGPPATGRGPCSTGRGACWRSTSPPTPTGSVPSVVLASH